MTRPLTVSMLMRTRGRAALAAAGVMCAALGVVPATAGALTVGIDLPSTVAVGQAGLTAQVTLTNTNALPATICGVGQCAGSQGILVVPSCGTPDAGGTCKTPDLGVFSFASAAAIPIGSCGPLVSGVTVAEADPVQGSLRIAPVGGSIVLATQTTCTITIQFGVLKQPAIDANPAAAGVQTLQSAAADAQVVPVGGAPVIESGAGRDVTTVLPRQVPPPPPPVVPPPPPPPPPAPVNLDHFKCYEALQSNLRRRTVGVRDQFGQRRARVLRTRQLCNPVSKNDGKVLQPRAHLTCYETRDTSGRFIPRTVVVTNQFGRRKLRVARQPSRLCVPSLKRRTAGALPSTPNPARLVDHFRCYDVTQQPAGTTVKLRDQFKTTTAKVVRVIRLCNPVRKNNEPVRRPKSHLVCYSITEPAFNPLGVRVRNQFGRAALRVRRPETLCLPSFKDVVATTAAAAAPARLGHFKCYEAEQPQFPPKFVGLRDQFGQSEGQVIRTREICNPVRKNNGRIINARAHLVCYETPSVGTVPFAPREVRVNNQFGIQRLSVVKPLTLCVPSLKRKGVGAAPTGPNPTLVLDHFRCYEVKPVTAARTVKLVDQFKTSKPKVRQIVRVCNPVRKNNEVVRRPRAHLVCYSIAEGPFTPLSLVVRNQFGVAAMKAIRPKLLCLPSFKKILTAADAEIAAASP